MTASRASAFVAVLAGGMLSWGAAVRAQDTPPLTSLPAAPKVNPLDRVGLVDTRSAGIPGWTWHGTSMAAARVLIADLPAAPQSRVLRDLQFRLLTAAATPPRPDGAVPLLCSLRIGELAAMGEAENADELLRLGKGGEGPMTSRLVTEALMRVRQRDSACARVQSAGEHLGETWWREAAIVCHLHARQTDAARQARALRAAGCRPRLRRAGRAIAGGKSAAGRPDRGRADPGAARHRRAAHADDRLRLAGRVARGDREQGDRAQSPRRARRARRALRRDRAGPPGRVLRELSRGLKNAAATSPTAWRAVVFAQAQGATSNEQRVVLAHRLFQVSRDTAGSAVRACRRRSPRRGDAHPRRVRRRQPARRDDPGAHDRASEWFKAAQAGPADQVADRMALLAPLAAIGHLPNRLPLDAKLMERRAACGAFRRGVARGADGAGGGAARARRRLRPRPRAPAIRRSPRCWRRPRPNAFPKRSAGPPHCGATPLASLEPAKVAAILRALVRINRRDVARAFAVEYAILADL